MSNTEGPARVIMWGTPRCLSTAFLKAMTNVENSVNWHEPYLYARRIGPDGSDRDKFRAQMDVMLAKNGMNREALLAIAKALPFGYVGSEGSYQWVKEQLEAEAPGKKLIFCKDMVEGIVDRYDALPSGFRHTFLLRHPAKVFQSFKKVIVGVVGGPDDLRKVPEVGLMPKGYFYKELNDLINHIKDNNIDNSPIILCTDELQKNPERVMKAYCKELNIPYSDKVIHWEDDGDQILQKWMVAKEVAIGLNKVHENVFASRSFGDLSPLPDVTSFDEDVQEVIEKCMPLYEEMHKARFMVKDL